MPAHQQQLRRGTSTQNNALTGADGELTYDTTNDRLRIHDGATAGGMHVPTHNDLRNQAFIAAATVGGTADAITLVYSPVTLSDAAPSRIGWVASGNNTGPADVEVDGRSAVDLKKWKGGILTDLEADDIISGQWVEAVSNGTYYILDRPDLGTSVASGFVPLAEISGGGGSYDFTGYITAAYESYLLSLQNIIPASDGVDLHLRVRRSGQGSYDSSGYGYAGQKNGGSSITQLSNTSAAQIVLASSISTSGSNGVGWSGQIFGHGLPLSVRSIFNWVGGEYVTNANFNHYTGQGSRNTAAALDGLQLRYSSGNIASGKAILWGLQSVT
jgi:hypothetical protein